MVNEFSLVEKFMVKEFMVKGFMVEEFFVKKSVFETCGWKVWQYGLWIFKGYKKGEVFA